METKKLETHKSYTLLTSRTDYEIYKSENGTMYGSGPAAYPCLVASLIDGFEEQYHEFLYLHDVYTMLGLLDAQTAAAWDKEPQGANP